jgi:esterase
MKILHSVILGNGEPLIILHGFFGMGDNWKTLGNKFSEDYEVHLIDQRNHGRSFHTDDFSYELMVEDLKNYIEYHKLNRVNLIGHSMGGKTAMLFAVEIPKKVNKLIVADIAPKYYPAHHQFILEALHAVDFSKVKSRNEIDLIIQRYIHEIGIRQFLLKNVFRKSKDEFAYRFNLDSLTANIEEIGVGLPSMTQFDGPTLFLKGENSGYISLEDEDLIHAHFPQSKLVIISKAGHWLHAENPSDFFSIVHKFLKNN